jgi:peptide/nickel transport system permease protein
MEVTRVIYGETLRWKAREFVDAAYALGVPRWRILLRHVLPHTAPAIIVSATLGVAYAILTESAISYLGLGIQPPTPSWGYMLKDAQGYIWTDPLLALLPGAAISLVVLAYNLVGDGLRDLLDPRRR